jgi:hypothetical protein
VAHAMNAQLIDQNFGGAAQIVLAAHRRLLTCSGTCPSLQVQ